MESVEGLAQSSDRSRVPLRAPSAAPLELRGRGADSSSELRYEGGFEQWLVACRRAAPSPFSL